MYLMFILALIGSLFFFTPMEKAQDTAALMQSDASDQRGYADMLIMQHLSALNYCFSSKPPYESNRCPSQAYSGGQEVPVHPNGMPVWSHFISWTDGYSFIATTICGNPSIGVVNADWIASEISRKNEQSSRVFVSRNRVLTNAIPNRSYQIPSMPTGNPCPHDRQVIFLNEINPNTIPQ